MVLSDLKQRGTYSFTKLQIILNKSTLGAVDIDDVTVLSVPFVPEYAKYSGSDAALKNTEDFCDFTTGYLTSGTGGINVSRDSIDNGSYVQIENVSGNNFAKITKSETVANGGTTVSLSRSYDGAVSGMDSYIVTFNIIAGGKETYTISCGGIYMSVNATTKAFRYYNGSWITAETPVFLNTFGWSKITYVITKKSDKNYADIYVNDIDIGI